MLYTPRAVPSSAGSQVGICKRLLARQPTKKGNRIFGLHPDDMFSCAVDGVTKAQSKNQSPGMTLSKWAEFSFFWNRLLLMSRVNLARKLARRYGREKTLLMHPRHAKPQSLKPQYTELTKAQNPATPAPSNL